MPKIPDKEKDQRYFLRAKDRYKTIHLSRGDYIGIKWWAKQQRITLTESLHQMIMEFCAPRLQAVKQKAIEDAVIEGKIDPTLFKKRRRIPFLRRKRS